MAILRHAPILFAIVSLAFSCPALAEGEARSIALRGMTGLNTVPDARMDPVGTIRIGASHADPYNHAFIGFQPFDPLYINLRQSMLVSSVGDRPDRVYPGMDVKLRLEKEGRYVPEIAFGMDSLLGHRRFSSEYFALSKRWWDFDFTAGLAWGRMAGAGLIPNPFGRTLSRFKDDRNLKSEDAASPSDWFTGDKIGIFGGVKYHTPVEGLSLKADFNPDSYKAERALFDYSRPAKWSLGFDYSPREWVTLGAAILGTDKIMARLTFQANADRWRGRSYKRSDPYRPLAPPKKTNPEEPKKTAKSEAFRFGEIDARETNYRAALHLAEFQPAAMQIGRAARHLAASAGPEVATITLVPVRDGVRGKAVIFSRRALDQAFVKRQASPEELWQSASFSDDDGAIKYGGGPRRYRILPTFDFSPLEEETSHMYRTSVLFEERKDWLFGIVSGTSLRLNLADNFERMEKFRGYGLNSVHSDADLFTMNRVNLDRSFLSFMRTVKSDFHFAATAGYLEEMYAGYGGEVLYRPFASPFAVGVDAWQVYKRDGTSPLALALTGVSAFTGHVSGYYDIPGTDVTAFAKVGKFIGGDLGTHVGAQTTFDNGVSVKAFVSVSDDDDKNVFGDSRNAYGGFQISLPLGNIPFVPEGSEARANIAQIGRDDAAMLDKPVSLYEVTEPMSYRRLGRSWQAVLN